MQLQTGHGITPRSQAGVFIMGLVVWRTLLRLRDRITFVNHPEPPNGSPPQLRRSAMFIEKKPKPRAPEERHIPFQIELLLQQDRSWIYPQFLTIIHPPTAPPGDRPRLLPSFNGRLTRGNQQLMQRGVQQAGRGGLGRGQPGFQFITPAHQLGHLRHDPLLFGQRGKGKRKLLPFAFADRKTRTAQTANALAPEERNVYRNWPAKFQAPAERHKLTRRRAAISEVSAFNGRCRATDTTWRPAGWRRRFGPW